MIFGRDLIRCRLGAFLSLFSLLASESVGVVGFHFSCVTYAYSPSPQLFGFISLSVILLIVLAAFNFNPFSVRSMNDLRVF